MDSSTNGRGAVRASRKRKRRGVKYSLTLTITIAITFASIASAMFMHTAWRLFAVRSTNNLSSRINGEIFTAIRHEVNDLFREVLRLQNTLYDLLRSDLADADIDGNLKSLYINAALNHETFSWISYGRPNGDFLGVRRSSDGSLQWNASYYDSATGTATRSREVYRTEGGGLILTETDSLVNEYYAPQRPWFRNAILTAEPRNVWTDVYVFNSPRVPGINSSIALRDPDTNEVQGVVSIAINLGRLSEIIAGIKVSANGILFIITDEREIVAYHDRDEVVAVNPDSTQLALRALAASGDIRLRLVNEALNSFTDGTNGDESDQRLAGVGEVIKLIEDTGGQSQSNLNSGSHVGFKLFSEENGEEYSIFLESLSNVDNDELALADLGWYLGITVPTMDILGAIVTSSRRLLIITYALILLIIGIVFIFIRGSLIRPIRQIAQQAEHIRRFELESVELPESSLSEINLLNQSMLRMNAGLNSFRKYVPTELVQQLIRKGLEARLGGTENRITIFFSDIARFTHISEILREGVIEHLDTYFTHLSNVIGNHGGTIDKYIGDAIMAFWGAPVIQHDHAIRACKAALRCSQVLQDLRADWKSKGQEQIYARFGINTGKALVGNFGSQVRMSYTAIGDSVNIASRLEGLNKIYGTEIIIGEETRTQLSQQFITRKLDRVAVYGRQESLEIFELVASRDSDSHPDAYQWIEVFEEGLAHYCGQRWKAAIKCFDKSHSQRESEDNVSLLFIKRCQHLMRRSVPGNWDGTFVLQSK